MCLIGLSVTLIMTPIFSEMIHIVYDKERQRPEIFGKTSPTAQAYGLFNVAFAAGTIIGPFMGGYVKKSAGWGTMGWSMGILSGVTSIPVFLVTGGWIGTRIRRRLD